MFIFINRDDPVNAYSFPNILREAPLLPSIRQILQPPIQYAVPIQNRVTPLVLEPDHVLIMPRISFPPLQSPPFQSLAPVNVIFTPPLPENPVPRQIKAKQNQVKNRTKKIDMVKNICEQCGAKESPEWRWGAFKDDQTQMRLCNKCGLAYKYSIRKKKGQVKG